MRIARVAAIGLVAGIELEPIADVLGDAQVGCETRDNLFDAFAEHDDAMALFARLLDELATALVDALFEDVAVVLLGELSDSVLGHASDRDIFGLCGKRPVVLGQVPEHGRTQREGADAERALREALRVAGEVGRGGQRSSVDVRSLCAEKSCGLD